MRLGLNLRDIVSLSGLGEGYSGMEHLKVQEIEVV